MISVCMPYYMRQAELDRTLDSYRKLYGHLDLEISICDDGSPVPVQAPGCRVSSLPIKNHALNPCVPINVAIRESSGDVIVLTNPEVEHVENVLDDMLALLEDENDYVTCACIDADGTWLAGERVNYRTHGRRPVPMGAHYHFCAMFQRRLFVRSGGFDESYRYGRGYEDVDWLWSLHGLGVRFRHCAKAVKHYRTSHRGKGPINERKLVDKWGAQVAR